jgi:hypothetical protein
MVHWQEVLGTSFLCHSPCLFGRAVETDPRIVGPDGHDREVDAAAAGDGAKLSRIGSVTGE